MVERSNLWREPAAYERHSATIQERNAETLAELAMRHAATVDSVLDVGCGTGSVLFHLCRRGPIGDVVALDLSPDMLARAQDRLQCTGARIEFQLGDFMVADVRHDFSLVVSNAALHWFDPDMSRVLSRLKSVTREGGIIAVTTAGACAEVRTFDAEVACAVAGRAAGSFARRRLEEMRFTELARGIGLEILDNYQLLRSTVMAPATYATWLAASGLEGDTALSVEEICRQLERHFGDTLTVRHCAVFGVFRVAAGLC